MDLTSLKTGLSFPNQERRGSSHLIRRGGPTAWNRKRLQNRKKKRPAWNQTGR